MLRITLVLAFATALVAQDPGTCYRFRVAAGLLTHEQKDLLEHEFDILHNDNKDGSHDVVVSVPQLVAWKALGIPATLVDRGRPYREIAAQQSGPLAPDPLFYTPAEIVAKIDALVAAYPTLALKVDLATIPGAAKTANNQSLWALKVSKNVAVDEDEPAILCIAQHHARELNAPVMVVEAMNRILTTYATDPVLKNLVDTHELWFVPCVNPDGTDYVWTNDNLWRKNRRNNGDSTFGVDNNRNYPFMWSATCGGSTQTSSETYRGPSAGSEAENKTMMALGAWLVPEKYVDFHSYGQDLLFPYGPCASPSAAITSYHNARIADLMGVMQVFSTRASSASGEAPHQHWIDRGTLSYLIEVGQAFQPTYASVIAEESAYIWPGVKRVFTTWQPAVRGHVRSVYQSQPVAATISYTPNHLTLGEKIASRARDGRYAIWAPVGSYQVTFSATGFQPVTKSVTISSLDVTQTLEIEMIPAWTDATLTKSGSDKIGTTTTFTYTSPGDGYWVTLSIGTSPGIPVGSRTVPLNPDALFFATATPGLLVGNLGTLPASGIVSPTFPIPPLPALINITVYAGGLTFEAGYPLSVKKFSPAVPITFQP